MEGAALSAPFLSPTQKNREENLRPPPGLKLGYAPKVLGALRSLRPQWRFFFAAFFLAGLFAFLFAGIDYSPLSIRNRGGCVKSMNDFT
jgi:hypothetical protein